MIDYILGFFWIWRF